MKKLYLSVLLSFSVFQMLSQDLKLESPFEEFKSDKGMVYRNNSVIGYKQYNDKMLNILFAKNVGTDFGGTNDLSLQKYFATIDQGDKSLAIGFNFNNRKGDELKKLSWIFSGAVKLKSKDNFAIIYQGNDFEEDNIGLNFKISYIGNGLIDFTSTLGGGSTRLRKKGFDDFEENHIKSKYSEIVNKFNNEELAQLKSRIDRMKVYDSEIPDLGEILKSKKDSLYKEMAKEEVAYLESAKMYNYLRDWWISAEIYIPFGENTYNITPSTTTSLREENFRAIEATFSGTAMWKYSSGKSIFLNGSISFKNNNSILANNLDSNIFQSNVVGPNGTVIIEDTVDGYIVDYKEFLTTTIKIEPVFFITEYIGISPSINKSFGEYDKLNWKIGIPISLKDKEGNPKVNFELQWKEINTMNKADHFVGVSTSFLFGDLIN